MIEAVQKFVLDRKLICLNDHVLAAVSGGADSVAMLIVLRELQERLSFGLCVCHLNHQLRGEDADADEDFVREFCEKIGVPLYTEKQDIRAVHQTVGCTLEETARQVRYDFFERAADYFHADKIALAHHRDDQCETIVFNLLRGSSFHGLRGIPVSRPIKPDRNVKIIRPMLGISKSEIEHFLRDRKIGWRDDYTNALLCADRNVIRHQVLPMLEQSNPSLRQHLLYLADQAAEIETILINQAKRFLSVCRQTEIDIRIETWRLEDVEKIVVCEVVRQMLLRFGAGLKKFSTDHFQDVASLTKSRIDLPGGLCARIERGWLIITKNKIQPSTVQVVEVEIDQPCRFERFEFIVRRRAFDPEAFETFLKSKTRFEEWIDADNVQGPLRIRYVRPGDRFHPLGSPGSKKISDFLTDVKAGFAEKPGIVITDDLGIVWLVGFRISQRVRIDEETRNVIIVQKLGLG